MPAPATRFARVVLALDFQPNAVHAGVLATHPKGARPPPQLALEVRAPSASTDSLKLLLSGRADASIVDIHDLGLARERGEDIVGVGAIVQRPLAAVIGRADVRHPRGLEGRRAGVTGLPSDDAVLTAVVQSDGGDPRSVRRTTIGFSAVPSLVAKKVDAVVTFWNAEGVVLRAARRAHARVPRRRLRRTPLPGVGRGGQALDARAPPPARSRARERPRRRDPRRPCRPAGRRPGRGQALGCRHRRWWQRSWRRSPRRSCRRCDWISPHCARWARFDARFGILEAATRTRLGPSPCREAPLSRAAAVPRPARRSLAPCETAAPRGEAGCLGAPSRVLVDVRVEAERGDGLELPALAHRPHERGPSMPSAVRSTIRRS